MLTAWYLGNLELPRGEASRTLIVSGEHLSPIARNAEGVVDDWRHPELASLTVGDAGAALLIDAEGAGPGLRGAHFETFHAHAELCIAGAHPSGPGGRMVTDAVAIHAEAIRALPGVAEKALDDAGLNYGDITRVVPHQTSARAIELAKRRFADVFAPGDPPWEVSLAETGNTGSTSHILALTQLAERGELREGDHLLFISSASGLVVAALVYTWDGETRVGVERC